VLLELLGRIELAACEGLPGKRERQERADSAARERVEAYVAHSNLGKGGKLYEVDQRLHKGREYLRAVLTRHGETNEWKLQAAEERLGERDAAWLAAHPDKTGEQYRDRLKAEPKEELLRLATAAPAASASVSAWPCYKTTAELEADLKRRA